MSGPFEKYVEQAAEAIDPPAFYQTSDNWPGPVRVARRRKARSQALAALAAVGPLIQEDARERMVAAAGAALEREGSGCAQAPTASREPEGKVLAALEKWYAEMDDDDGPFAFNYSTGQLMEASPESLKSLLETATKLGLELGRKEALAEIADEMGAYTHMLDDPRIKYIDVQIDKDTYRQIMAAREIATEDAS